VLPLIRRYPPISDLLLLTDSLAISILFSGFRGAALPKSLAGVSWMELLRRSEGVRANSPVAGRII